MQPQVAGGSHLSAFGPQAFADASPSQPLFSYRSRRTARTKWSGRYSTTEETLLFNLFLEHRRATRFWGGGTTRHKYLGVPEDSLGHPPYRHDGSVGAPYIHFSFDATEEAKYLQAYGLKQMQYSLHEPRRYEDACFDRAALASSYERRYPGENFCSTPGYLRMRREGGIRSQNRRRIEAIRDSSGVIVTPGRTEYSLGPSPGWTDDRELTFAEFLLTRNTRQQLRVRNQMDFFRLAINNNSDALTNVIRKLGFADLTGAGESKLIPSSYERAAYGYYARNLLGHEYDQISLAQAREFQAAYDTRATNPDLYDALDRDLKIRMHLKIGEYNYIDGDGLATDTNPATNPLRDSNGNFYPATRPSELMDQLIATDALLRLEYMDDCLSLDDVFSQRCGKFDPYRHSHNGDLDYAHIVVPSDGGNSYLYSAATIRFHVAYAFKRRGQPNGLYNPYNLPEEFIPDVSRRDNPY